MAGGVAVAPNAAASIDGRAGMRRELTAPDQGPEIAPIEGKRVVVTGGAGFIGSHLVERLAERNSIVVVDDLSTGRAENIAGLGCVELVEADVADLSAIETVVGSADLVLHLAVSNLRTSLGDPAASLRVNDGGTLNVLMAALRGGVEKFVYVSSSEVYGSAQRAAMDEEHPLAPRTPYAAGKLAGEAYALSFHRTFGMPVTVVRPFNTYGPRAHLEGTAGEVIPKFAARCLAGRPLHVFGSGRQSRDFTWVGDTVRGIELAAASPDLIGEAVNIAAGTPVTILEIAAAVQRLLGRSVPVVHDAERPGDVQVQVADVSKARRLLGFQAEVGIEDGLGRYLEWLRTQPGNPERWLEREEVMNWQLASAPG